MVWKAATDEIGEAKDAAGLRGERERSAKG